MQVRASVFRPREVCVTLILSSRMLPRCIEPPAEKTRVRTSEERRTQGGSLIGNRLGPSASGPQSAVSKVAPMGLRGRFTEASTVAPMELRGRITAARPLAKHSGNACKARRRTSSASCQPDSPSPGRPWIARRVGNPGRTPEYVCLLPRRPRSAATQRLGTHQHLPEGQSRWQARPSPDVHPWEAQVRLDGTTRGRDQRSRPGLSVVTTGPLGPRL